MKPKHSFFTFALSAASLAFMGMSSPVLAKSLNLLDQPKADAKVVASIDLSEGMIPIFTPKDGKWMKVADPKNGNVGWIKISDVENEGSAFSEFSFSEGPGNGKTYHVIQYGQPARKLTPEQAQALAREQEARYQAMQRSMMGMMHEMNHMFEEEWSHPPMFVPVVFVPVQKTTASAQAKTPHHKVAATSATAATTSASTAEKTTENASKQKTSEANVSVANNTK